MLGVQELCRFAFVWRGVWNRNHIPKAPILCSEGTLANNMGRFCTRPRTGVHSREQIMTKMYVKMHSSWLNGSKRRMSVCKTLSFPTFGLPGLKRPRLRGINGRSALPGKEATTAVPKTVPMRIASAWKYWSKYRVKYPGIPMVCRDWGWRREGVIRFSQS